MEEVKVKFVYENDFETQYINGAFGGFNSKGDFVMNLFFENITKPTGSTLTIYEQNIDEKFETENIVNRHVKSSVVMNLQTAKAIYEWLKNNIDNYEKDNGK